MDEINRVFLPLRSNIGWFKSPDLREDISNRVKESILLYDEIFIEDGTFKADLLEMGATKWYFPPGVIPLEQRTIEYEDLKPSDVTIGIGRDGDIAPRATILKGHAADRFKIDYYEIFKNIDKSDYDFLKFITCPDYSLPRRAKDIIREQSWDDKRIFKSIHPNDAIRDLVIDNLNHDIVLSVLLKSSIIMDSGHRDLLKEKCWRPETTYSSKPVAESVALREILNIEVPDFSKIPIERVLELREDRLWTKFRDLVRNIASTVKDDPEILANPDDFEKKILCYYARELSREHEKTQSTKSKLEIDFCIGFTSLIPGYGYIPTLVGMGKSLKGYWDDKSTWFAFLLKLKSASKP